MLRASTVAKWKPVITGYDPQVETIGQYCARKGIESKKYYHYRKLLRELDEPQHIELVPLEVVDASSSRSTSIRINDVPVTYAPDSIDDQELSRILRLCRDL